MCEWSICFLAGGIRGVEDLWVRRQAEFVHKLSATQRARVFWLPKNTVFQLFLSRSFIFPTARHGFEQCRSNEVSALLL
jgi:hypothetical protein